MAVQLWRVWRMNDSLSHRDLCISLTGALSNRPTGSPPHVLALNARPVRGQLQLVPPSPGRERNAVQREREKANKVTTVSFVLQNYIPLHSSSHKLARPTQSAGSNVSKHNESLWEKGADMEVNQMINLFSEQLELWQFWIGSVHLSQLTLKG